MQLKKNEKIEKKNVFELRRPEDEAISLFTPKDKDEVNKGVVCECEG